MWTNHEKLKINPVRQDGEANKKSLGVYIKHTLKATMLRWAWGITEQGRERKQVIDKKNFQHIT